MKTIELKQTTESASIAGKKTEVELKTLDLITIAVEAAPEGGFTPTEMVNRVRVLDAIDALSKDSEGQVTAEVLELEDADYNNLKKWVAAVKWTFISRFIVDFTAQFK